MSDQNTIDEFHKVFYDSALSTWASTFWLGVPAEKYPCDLWIYQEIIQELKPDFVIETGTRFGGSALFMASICDLIGHGHVITVDVEELPSSSTVRPPHSRITYLTGSSTSADVVADVRARVDSASCVMVVLDSDHQMTHVVNEMKIYADLVTDDSYMIVEDTNINGHPVDPAFGHGPMEAVELFLAGNDDFFVDRSREKLLLSFNPGGFLRKVAQGGVRARLLSAESRLEQLHGELAAQTARADEAMRLAEASRAELEQAHEQLEERDKAHHAELEQAHEQLEERDKAHHAELARIHEQLEERDTIIVEKEQGLARLEERLTAAEEVCHTVENSASWRVTAPLRGAKRFLKGG
jgi:cephalosporin hydroxylase